MIFREVEKAWHKLRGKEKEPYGHLPPVFIRLFGDIDFDEQLNSIPEKFKQNIVILTTSDTPADVVESLRLKNWKVVYSESVNTDQAKTNSSLLLNEALKYAEENNISHVFFLSSGFQRKLDMFYSMVDAMMKKYPNEDVYYFILPETHINLSTRLHLNAETNDIEKFLAQFFPFESALVMKTSMFSTDSTASEFESVLSKKGALGKTEEGIDLGGMEFFITLLSILSKLKEEGKTFSPNMTGITLPMLTRPSQELLDFYRMTGEVPTNYLESLNLPQSLEVTSAEDKLARRLETFRAVMKELGITDDDVRKLFSNTNFESGVEHAFRFRDENSPKI